MKEQHMHLLAAETSASLVNAVHHADIFDLCERMARAGLRADMVLADLPYGTTGLKEWDNIIPFEPMWQAFRKITHPNAAIVLTASQPFTSMLVMSNLKMFRYSWIWVKSRASDFINANYRPMKTHEDVLIFSQANAAPGAIEIMPYYPQGLITRKLSVVRKGSLGIGRDRASQQGVYTSQGANYPTSILNFASEMQTEHPTQKPVALFRYLIRTYTRPGELVFDPCAGSGTTAVAAREEGRRFVVGDSSAEYVQVARDRLAMPYTPSFLPQLEQSAQL